MRWLSSLKVTSRGESPSGSNSGRSTSNWKGRHHEIGECSFISWSYLVYSYTMVTRFNRRRFLAATGVGVTYLALTGTVGCDLRGRVREARTPEVGSSVSAPKVWPTRNVSSSPSGGAWDFRSRPDLRPPTVAVNTRARGRARGHVFVAPKLGRGQHGPMIVDD